MGELKIFCSGRGNEELKIIRSPFSLFRLHLFLYQNNIEGVFSSSLRIPTMWSSKKGDV